MERILISRNTRGEYIANLLFVTGLFIFIMVMHPNKTRYGYDPAGFTRFQLASGVMMIMLFLLLLYRAFTSIHPVTFDDKNVYWEKNKTEHRVEISKVESVRVSRPRGGYVCELKFEDESGNIKSIGWWLPADERYPFPRYRILEQCIGKPKLDFRVKGIHRADRMFWFGINIGITFSH